MGIGTNNPSSALHVLRSADPAIRIEAATSGSAWLVLKPVAASGTAVIHNLSAAATTFTTNGTEKMRIESNGNVGVGTTTPYEKLSIVGNLSTTDSMTINADDTWSGFYADTASNNKDGQFIFIRSRGTRAARAYVQNDDPIGEIYFRDHTDSSGGAFISGVSTETHTASAKGTKLSFNTVPNGSTSSATAMTISSDGNVGIGTNNPSRPLHVSASSGATIILENTSSGADLKKRYINTGTFAAGSMAFGKFSDDMSGVSNHMLIDTSGNVGIGTTAPEANLHVVGSAIMAPQTLLVVDEKASGTAGGGCTAGSWLTRDLNTVKRNTITGASVASNQITLPAGTYEMSGSAPGFFVDRHKTRLRSITGATDLIIGTSEYSQNGAADGYDSTRSQLNGVFTLVVTTVVELQHRCQTTNASANALGVASTFGVNEVYSIVKITRIQ